jgi:sensor histidine kinase YesM
MIGYSGTQQIREEMDHNKKYLKIQTTARG